MYKKITQILLILSLIIILQGCTNPITDYLNSNLKKEIVEKMEEEIPGEEFYWIQGIDSNWSMSTNIRHRGILYSKRLEQLNYPGGLELGLENRKVTDAKVYNWKKHYESIFQNIEFEYLGQNKTREIFGVKSNFKINWTMTPPKYKGLKKNLGKKNISRKEKYGSWNTIVNIFGDDLERLDIEEYKKKTYELSKYIYDYMNYVTSLQIYVRDDSYFENYDLVKASIYKPFRKREEIKEILRKVKKGDKLDEKEKIELINNFRKGITYDTKGIFNQADYKRIISSFKYKNEIPLKFHKNVGYYDLLKNGEKEYPKEGE